MQRENKRFTVEQVQEPRDSHVASNVGDIPSGGSGSTPESTVRADADPTLSNVSDGSDKKDNR